jgi:hypothetical protein
LRPPTEAVERQAELAKPAWVVFPTHADNAVTKLDPVRKAAGFVRLETNCFNYRELGENAFEALGKVISKASCFALPFADVETAAELVDGLAEGQPAATVPLDAA